MQPPRTYHCKYCGECVLRLDHHCKWIGTCIGFTNFKFYWQFLLYASLSMLIILTTSLVMDGISILSLMAFVFYFDFTVLFVIQTHLVLKNRTAVDKGDLQGNFDIFKGKSKCENWQ